jgi:nucleoside-diphosphate-sugar epimerase
MKSVLVLGAGGFIGSHMVRQLKSEGYLVCGADLKFPEFSETLADEFFIGDLRKVEFVEFVLSNKSNILFDEIYQFAADMGGAGYLFTGENDADVLHNSASINLNVLETLKRNNARIGAVKTKIFYSSSACMYPAYNQVDPKNPNCKEDSAYPADPDSEYGWEKLFSERLYMAYARNYKIPIAIARYHNIFGPEGTWKGGKEKAPAAICRKIAEVSNQGEIEIWGDGTQTRSFLYIDECINATRLLMKSHNFTGPVNIGSDEMVTINQLVKLTSKIAGKTIKINYVQGPVGVMGRNSNNDLIREKLGYVYTATLADGILKTYHWIANQLALSRA